MTPQRINVADNIRLSYINTDKFKTESLTISLPMPITPENYLLCSLLCGVLKRGCSRLRTVRDVNRELDELYASTLSLRCSADADQLSLCIYIDALDNRFAIDGTDILGGVLSTASDLLLRPLLEDGVFLEDTVKKEAKAFSDLINNLKSNTRAYALARLGELMGRNMPDNITLDFMTSHIRRIDAKSLFDFYSALIASTSFEVFYVGAQSSERVALALRSAFAAFCGTGLFAHRRPILRSAEPFLCETEDMNVSQGKLAMGARTGVGFSNGKHALGTMLNEIFGASPSSKLFINVREKLGLCYYCRSSYSPLTGDLTVSSGIDVSKRDTVAEQILNQLDSIAKGEISDLELKNARRSLEYTYAQIFDSPYSLQSFYILRDTSGVEETVEEYLKKLLSVEAEDICELAKSTVYDTQFFINGIGGSEEADDDE